MTNLQPLAQHLGLGALLAELARSFGRVEHLEHWTQGEFHHDIVLRLADGNSPLVLVVSTNCNGGVKELISFAEVPDRSALWHSRCPENPEFSGAIPPVLGSARTVHWFDPCNLLTADARSELLPEHRERQAGGGWMKRTCRLN